MTTRKLIFITSLITFSVCSYGAEESPIEIQQEAQTSSTRAVTNPMESSHLVLKHQVEDSFYWDWWQAYPIDKEDKTEYYYFLITREGKSGPFTGSLELNCKEKTEYWQWGVQYHSEIVDESFFKEEIPKGVVKNIIKKYCS